MDVFIFVYPLEQTIGEQIARVSVCTDAHTVLGFNTSRILDLLRVVN